jgi:hypothetical protein
MFASCDDLRQTADRLNGKSLLLVVCGKLDYSITSPSHITPWSMLPQLATCLSTHSTAQILPLQHHLPSQIPIRSRHETIPPLHVLRARETPYIDIKSAKQLRNDEVELCVRETARSSDTVIGNTTSQTRRTSFLNTVSIPARRRPYVCLARRTRLDPTSSIGLG